MGRQYFRQQRDEVFDSIERRLGIDIPGKRYPTEISRTLEFVMYDEFRRTREIEGGGSYSLKPKFVGHYFVDPENPEQVRVLSGHGTEACSPIPISRGVIGRAIRTGEDQYVPDVTKDPEHVACDEEMEGTEIVLVSWSEPYTQGEHKGCRIPLGVLDVDLNVLDALSQTDVGRLKRIWKQYNKQIFPGEPGFELPKGSRIYRRCPNGK